MVFTYIFITFVFFLFTDVSARHLVTVDKKRSPDGSFLDVCDRRGKKRISTLKVSEEDKDSAREHIKMFPLMKSHYYNGDLREKYLEEGLSLARMYRMYEKHMLDKGLQKKVTEKMYAHIFAKDFNYRFYKPKNAG